ncbi:MAG: hypothetical protein EZS28_026454 [Streblomastix strix]|uniref:Uncharacterized protein n=1 Tax=Streblomastix strix TaxID=222440 RepID=A0A5J4V6N2_9EUKA|nr:MAG: hypothetical protein EZS28_026454 [Streblomastix strix]
MQKIVDIEKRKKGGIPLVKLTPLQSVLLPTVSDIKQPPQQEKKKAVEGIIALAIIATSTKQSLSLTSKLWQAKHYLHSKQCHGYLIRQRKKQLIFADVQINRSQIGQ